jgi:gluconate 2-dehydrogenase gamma chain
MANDEEPSHLVSRKRFVHVSSVGVAGAVALAACNTGNTASNSATPAPSSATAGMPSTAPVPAETAVRTYVFFVGPEQQFVEAAVERLIPTDQLGPGARDAGVSFFIDRQLDGQFGYAAKMYMQGPWSAGTAEQGYQLPLMPREIYRLGIAQANDYCRHTYGGKTFDQLRPEQQDAALTALQKGNAHLATVPATVFFQMLYDNTIEGFFADPLYGGNRDMIGWKLIGFPGVAAYYRPMIPNYINKQYAVEPVSIAGVVEQMEMPAQSSAAPSGTSASHTPLRILAMHNASKAGGAS